ncbi:hypothetical protein DPMN_189270 [Dreissena polymorpha]|uniref:Uncharacterized protein n=1 Tax=Dreissena polymorpha TaxID=45954 RepID=A0A9D4DRN6_DREPO|nr:hypothetical protein DPMN_189270 [Dreissena polymorpha]
MLIQGYVPLFCVHVAFSAPCFQNVISLEFGVVVNVFWKHLDDSIYDTKDTYGYKDLQPATQAFQITDRAIKALEEMPGTFMHVGLLVE